MHNNKKGFSLPLAMGIVVLISLLAGTILEYIIPFSKEIKGIENTSKAYYQANSGIEEGLYHINNRASEIAETGSLFNGDLSVKYNTYSSGVLLPPVGEGNSEFDKNKNTISTGNPIQLSIGNGYISDINDLEILFNVPDLSGNGSETLNGANIGIINWQLSAINNTLNSSGSLITASDVDESDILIKDRNGADLNGDSKNFEEFYIDNCNGSSGCTLKLSIINKIETTDGILLPYLERQIKTGTSKIPLRYSIIKSKGRSYGYIKELKLKVPSNTVNEAFDFTVFQ